MILNMVAPLVMALITILNQPFPKRQILDSSKLKEFADDNSEFDENGRKFSKWVENTGKRRNCLLRAISPFPAVFSKHLYCRQVKTGLVWEWVYQPVNEISGKIERLCKN